MFILNDQKQEKILILLAEHASAEIPEVYCNLGLPSNQYDLEPGMFYDPITKEVTLELCEVLQVNAHLGDTSRLVIDLNRLRYDDDLIPDLYHGVDIPANHNLMEKKRRERIKVYYEPFHKVVIEDVEKRLASNNRPKILSIHSFSLDIALRIFPELERREVDIAILFDKENELVEALRKELGQTGVVVAENYPYNLQKLRTGTIFELQECYNLPVAGIEMNANAMKNKDKLDLVQKALVRALS